MQTRNKKIGINLKAIAISDRFAKIWESLFVSPIHLDSALSKQPKNIKTILAQILPAILLRPASLAEVLGIGIPPGEPWCLSLKDLSQWQPARLMAERLYENMSNPVASVHSIEEDFPPHFIQEWKSHWGNDISQILIETLAQEPPLGIRVNHSTKPHQLLEELTKGGRLSVRAELSSISPLGIRLGGYAPILKLDAYQNGVFEIQDEGSQVMALFTLWPEIFGNLLKEKPTHLGQLRLNQEALKIPAEVKTWTVIDACAGAGGKSLALGDLLKGKGRIYAYDVSEKKLQALRKRATRARLTNIQTLPLVENFERDKIEKFFKSADRVLVDAPCSGWGVLRRNPDIKWRQSLDTLNIMPGIQSRLLNLYAELVAPGGRLTYGVCTFRKDETTEVVNQFNSKNSEFIPQEGGYLGPGPCDGFFMQSWIRKS